MNRMSMVYLMNSSLMQQLELIKGQKMQNSIQTSTDSTRSLNISIANREENKFPLTKNLKKFFKIIGILKKKIYIFFMFEIQSHYLYMEIDAFRRFH